MTMIGSSELDAGGYHGSELLKMKFLLSESLDQPSIKMRLSRTISFSTASSSMSLVERDDCSDVEDFCN